MSRRVYTYPEGLYRGIGLLYGRLEEARSLIAADATPPYRACIDSHRGVRPRDTLRAP